MEYPWERQTIRIYQFFFYGLPDPIIVEAIDKQTARGVVNSMLRSLRTYQNRRVINETVMLPITGVTTKKVNGVSYVWVGEVADWVEEKKYRPMIHNELIEYNSICK